jgi:hypothetical protein
MAETLTALQPVIARLGVPGQVWRELKPDFESRGTSCTSGL